MSRLTTVRLIIPNVLLAFEYAYAQCFATSKLSEMITPKSFYSLMLPSSASFMKYFELMFVRPKCITLHFSTLNAICQSCDQSESLRRSCCSIWLSSRLLTIPKSFVSSANFNMKLIISQSFTGLPVTKHRTTALKYGKKNGNYGAMKHRTGSK